jgi:enoyl-CoA hydratase
MSRSARDVLDAIRRFPVPVVAALNGDALGGGAELAVACDMRVAAAHARIGFVQGRLAITTGWGGGIDLAAIVGHSRALALLCRSDLLTSAEARAVGLVDLVAEPGEALGDAVTRFISPMLDQAPHVLRAFKALSLVHRRGASRDELERVETERFAQAWVHDDHWAAADAVLARSS